MWAKVEEEELVESESIPLQEPLAMPQQMEGVVLTILETRQFMDQEILQVMILVVDHKMLFQAVLAEQKQHLSTDYPPCMDNPKVIVSRVIQEQ